MPKKKVLEFPAPKAAGDRAAVIDELGRLTDECAAIDREMANLALERDLETKESRIAVLTAEVLAWVATEPAAKELTIDGKAFAADITAKEKKRTIVSMLKVFMRFGQDLFLAKCGLTLKELETVIPEAERPLFVNEERTGPRRVTVRPKAAQAKKAA